MTQKSRREFLQWCMVLGTATLFNGLFPRRAMAAGAAGDVQKENWISLGKLSDFPENQAFAVESAANLATGKPVKKPKFVVFRKGDSASVMSSECTHRGCKVGLQGDGSYLCSCHKSAFDKTGAVTHGPAKKALPWFEARISKEGNLEVNTGKTVAAPAI